MNILSLSFFRLLKSRTGKLSALLKAKEAVKKEYEQNWGGVDRTAYTIVKDPNSDKKRDLFTSVHQASRHLDQAKAWHRMGKARWHKNTNEQQYNPREIHIDRQLEFIYDELGLSQDLEQTVIGPPNHAADC